MKTTFLVRDGLTQVVLHPETKTERAVLDLISSDLAVDVHRAQFAETQGGYVRQFGLSGHYGVAGSDHLPDLLLVLRPVEITGDPAPATDAFPPDDGGLTYFRKMPDETWQVHTKVGVDGTRAWRPATGVPGVDQRYDAADLMTEVARLRDALRDIRRESRDAVRVSEVPVSKAMVVDLCSALARAARRCDDALGGEKHDHVGGDHD